MNKGYRYLMISAAVILTAKLGRIPFNGHIETWYNLPMTKVVERTDEQLGLSDMYWIRDDGCKMYGPWIIVAADPSVTRYTIVETSRGTGIVLDTQTTGDADIFDLAVEW